MGGKDDKEHISTKHHSTNKEYSALFRYIVSFFAHMDSFKFPSCLSDIISYYESSAHLMSKRALWPDANIQILLVAKDAGA